MASTRATQVLEKAGILHEVLSYEYDADAGDIAMQAAKALGISPGILLKTLMLTAPPGPMIALVPADRRLNLKALAATARVKGCALMAKHEAERISGYQIGGISPLGQKRRLPVVVDDSVAMAPFVVCNGGRRGLQIRLAPADLARAAGARFAAISNAGGSG